MRRALQFVAALWFALTTGAAERIAHWRNFAVAESPIVSVTLGARGRILACKADGSAVTILDGYSLDGNSVRQVNLPENIARPARVYESRSGQLWIAYTDG